MKLLRSYKKLGKDWVNNDASLNEMNEEKKI